MSRKIVLISPSPSFENEKSSLMRAIFEPDDHIKMINYKESTVLIDFSYLQKTRNPKPKISLLKPSQEDHQLEFSSDHNVHKVESAVKSLVFYIVTGYFEFDPSEHSLQIIISCAIKLCIGEFLIEFLKNIRKIESYVRNIDIGQIYKEAYDLDSFKYDAVLKVYPDLVEEIVQITKGLAIFEDGKKRFKESLKNIPLDDFPSFIEICAQGLQKIKPFNQKSFLEIMYSLIQWRYCQATANERAEIKSLEKANRCFSKLIESIDVKAFTDLKALGFLLEHCDFDNKSKFAPLVKKQLKSAIEELKKSQENQEEKIIKINREIEECRSYIEAKKRKPNLDHMREPGYKFNKSDYKKPNENDDERVNLDSGIRTEYNFKKRENSSNKENSESMIIEESKENSPEKNYRASPSPKNNGRGPSPKNNGRGPSPSKIVEGRSINGITHFEEREKKLCETSLCAKDPRVLTLKDCNHKICFYCLCERLSTGTAIKTKNDLDRYKNKCLVKDCDAMVTSKDFDDEKDFEQLCLIGICYESDSK